MPASIVAALFLQSHAGLAQSHLAVGRVAQVALKPNPRSRPWRPHPQPRARPRRPSTASWPARCSGTIRGSRRNSLGRTRFFYYLDLVLPRFEEPGKKTGSRCEIIAWKNNRNGVIRLHAIQSQNVGESTGNVSENTSKFTSETN